MAKVDKPARGELQSSEFSNPTELTSAKETAEGNKKLDKNFRKYERMKKLKNFCNNRRKRHWRPYCKLSFQEKQKLGERETRRALRTYNQRLATGLPVAPYNTTQFLMEDRYEQEGKFQNSSNGKLNLMQDPHDGLAYNLEAPDDYLEQDFENMYNESMNAMSNSDLVHNEGMYTMSNSDLALKVLDLEDRVESLQNTLRELRLRNRLNPRADLPFDFDCELEKIYVYRKEIDEITRENAKLRTSNETLSLALAVTSA